VLKRSKPAVLFHLNFPRRAGEPLGWPEHYNISSPEVWKGRRRKTGRFARRLRSWKPPQLYAGQFRRPVSLSATVAASSRIAGRQGRIPIAVVTCSCEWCCARSRQLCPRRRCGTGFAA
jgi:hypothetical protein